MEIGKSVRRSCGSKRTELELTFGIDDFHPIFGDEKSGGGGIKSKQRTEV